MDFAKRAKDHDYKLDVFELLKWRLEVARGNKTFDLFDPAFGRTPVVLSQKGQAAVANINRWNHGAIVNPKHKTFGSMTDSENNFHSNVLYQLFVWCENTYGKVTQQLRWYKDGYAFYFKSKNDLIIFKLHWAEFITATASKENTNEKC